jgi:hypothetical protein
MQRIFKNHDWLRRILLMAIITPFVLLWGEVFTKTLLPQNVDPKMDIFISDPYIGIKYKPNSWAYEKGKEYKAPYQINSLGLRDREYGLKKEGVFRILLLGDSFSVSHGLPIEESLSRQMERALQQLADNDGLKVSFEVINASVGGYSPYNYYKAYGHWAPIIKPDAVLVGLSPDDYEKTNDNVPVKRKPEVGERLSGKKIRKWLSWNSEFYILMRNFFYYNDLVGRIIQWLSPGGIETEDKLNLYIVSHMKDLKKVWAQAFFHLRNLKKETAADDRPLALIPIPLKMEIDNNQYQQVLKTKGLKSILIDLDQQLREITIFCKSENIPVLDPRPALRERNARVQCYFVYDGHWNAEGIRVAADSIARQWRNLRIQPWLF